MAFAASSDRLVAIAWLIGVVALAAAVALALQVIAMRARTNRRERRQDALFERWRPILFEVALGGAPRLPALAPRDEGSFLLLWNQLQDAVRGESQTRLAVAAEDLGARAMAERRLERADSVGRLLALRTLGHLGRASDYDRIVPHLDDLRAYHALAAAKALVRIDPARAPDDLLPRLAVRHDWPVPLFVTVLGETDPGRRSARLRSLLDLAAPEPLIRLLPLVTLLHGRDVVALLRRLARSDDPEIVGAALKRVEEPALLPEVRLAVGHAAWPVRTQAASALGRIGEPEDRERLLALLRDAQWWVRYRAAQALTSGRFGGALEVTELAGRLGDRFALDIVEHALAERRT